MKKIIITLSIFLITMACSEDNSDKSHFFDIYKNILLVREQYPDTSVANPKVREILEKNGYTTLTFKNKFMEISQDREEFIKMMDSIKTKVKNESDSLIN